MLDAGTRNGKPDDFSSRGSATQKVLFETTRVEELTSFAQCFRIMSPRESFHCRCRGWPVIQLSKGLFQRVNIGLHHGLSIRVHGWASDAPLEDGRRVCQWLAERGVAGPLADLEADERRRDEARRAFERWKEAAPVCLAPLGKKLFELPDALLQAAYPQEERVASLVRWYGSGLGPWSGFPAYESWPQELLRAMPTSEVVTSLAHQDRDAVELEGLARLLTERARVNADDRQLALPAELKRRLAEHMAAHPIADNRLRFSNVSPLD
ncbi:MAG: hypothetical protein ACOZIN_12835 [Myxococcota bacterium]